MKLTTSPYTMLFWNDFLINPNRNDYNVVFDQNITGDLDINRLNKVLLKLVEQYVLLNSHLYLADDKLYWNRNSKIFELEIFDISSNSEDFVHKPFDLKVGPLYRFGLFKLGKQHYNLILVFHHVVIDGNSFDQLINFISDSYNNGTTVHNYELEKQIQKINQLNDQLYQKINYIKEKCAIKFWHNLLKNCEPFIDISFTCSKSQSCVEEYRFNIATNLIDKDQLNAVNSTIFKYLIGCYAYLLSRYSGLSNIHVSYPIRIKESDDLLYGGMINTVVLPIEVDSDDTLLLLLSRINDHIDKCRLDNQHNYSYLPTSEIVTHGPIKQLNVSFAQTNLKDKKIIFDDCSTSINRRYNISINRRYNISIAGNNLLLEYQESGSLIEFRCRYKRELFNDSFIVQFCNHYRMLVENLIKQPSLKLVHYNLLSHIEYRNIVYDWNATDKAYHTEKTVHQLFIEQAAKTPNNTALVFEGNELTYQELDIRSSQLAHKILREYQHHTGEELKPDTLIALCVDRSLEMIVGILATLKAGAAYVPLDHEFPDERLNYILEDTNSRLLLTQNHYVDRLKQVIPSERNVCLLDISSYSSYEQELVSTPLTETTAKNLAYVIYTSGTTGKPKGVMIEHRSLINRLYEMVLYSNINGDDIYCFKTSYVFDVSFSDIFTHLISGARIICTRDKFDLFELQEILTKNTLTAIHLVPSQYSSLSEFINRSSIKKVYFSGEPMTKVILDTITEHIDLYNYYGPTETGEITFDKVNRYNKLIIGKSFHNSKLYVLDINHNPVPIGVIGELYIAGAGLARGYLNNHELTTERFITNPFASESDLAKGYTRMYKTGDLVRWLPDGNLEYIGRNDFQVKIRGYRIELGEIEEQLLKIDVIKQAVVLAKKDQNTNNDYLVAYYVLDKSLNIDCLSLTKDYILDILSNALPDYMLPSAFMKLDTLPLTINGKLDRSALPNVVFERSDNYVAPSNFIEHSICKIFSELLGLEKHQISVYDSFFALGGNSILAIKLVNMLRNNLNMNISALDIFQKKTIYNLANKSNDLLNDKGDYYEIHNETDINAKYIVFLIPGITDAFERYYLPLLDEFKNDKHYRMLMIKNKYLGIENLDKAADDYSNLIIELLYANKCSQVNLCGFSAGGEIAYRICSRLKQKGFNSLRLIAIDSALNRYGFAPKLINFIAQILQINLPQFMDNKMQTFNNKHVRILLNLDVIFFKAKKLWYKRFIVPKQAKYRFLRQLKANLTYILTLLTHNLRLVPLILRMKVKVFDIKSYHTGENGIMSRMHSSTIKKYIDQNILL